ncbi:MAG: 3-oxoacyl-ACP reductase FabG [Porticoccaceae bacterium]|jgi:3-oxoacyl-[acyl-carrier protein] reductase|nr:3-oxoacyl-ACP reductase FabG [Gammaproteobacteria bacterium]TAL06440.1 MAG: 3-oxoacyl-ACP reductase FabG [Porticoccaceae bacterium]
MSIVDKIALVTGASRGIGAAIADALGRAGAIVIGTATTPEGAERISARFAGLGIKGRGMALNVTDAAAVVQVVQQIEDEFGPPLILVNNAGITRDNLLLRMKEDEWNDVIETNLGAAYRLCKACARGMTRARWGRIINISSVVGAMGNAGQANYAATKAGVAGFGRALAKELGSRNITVNTVAPGFIDTDMTRELPAANRDAMLASIPLGRLGQPEEIAAVVVFLAEDGGAYITGETIQVNGGMYMG